MENHLCRLLLIESDPADAELAVALLTRQLPDCQVDIVADAVSYAERWADNGYAAVIAEQDLGWANGVDLLASVSSRLPHVPTILFCRQMPPDIQRLQHEIGFSAWVEKNSGGYLALSHVLEREIGRNATADTGESSWSQALKNLQEPALTLEPDSRIVAANAPAAREFGELILDAAGGQRLADLFDSQQLTVDTARWIAGIGGSPDDQEEYLEFTAAPAMDPQREAVYRLCAWRIPGASNVALTLRIDRKTDTAEGSPGEISGQDERYQQLLYAVSHDLQEPLQLVTRHADLLKEAYSSALDAHGVRFMGNLVDNAHRMQTMLDDLLELSRLGKPAEVTREIDLNAVVDEVLAMYQPTLEEIGGTVRKAGLPSILADKGQMSRLFQNLLGNAIKFRGDQPLTVTIGARVQGDYWELVVKDNGIGVEPARVERIFNMFDRLHSNQEYPGNGMGLALCKRIVDMHGGRIWARPRAKPGSGLAVHFTLSKAGPRTAEKGDSVGEQVAS